MRNSRLIAGMILALALASANLVPGAIAAETDLTKQHEVLLEQIDQVQGRLNEKKNEENKALNELKQLNNTLNTTTKKLQDTQRDLSKTEGELSSLEEELETTEKSLKENADTLKERLRTYYTQGDIHYLEVLFNSASLSDFLTRWDLLGRVAESDTKLIDYLKKTVALYEDKLELTRKKKETLAHLRVEQDQRTKELNVASSRQKALVQKISTEKKDIEAALDELEDESNRIAASILQKTGADTARYLGSGKMLWPTPGYTRITSPYGWRRHPILKQNKLHTGTDIGAPSGSAIKAAEQGIVLEAGWRGAYGQAVIINHGGGIATLYAHASKILVQEGEVVAKGQKIALVGSTGLATGPHLHFEVRKNGSPVDPMPYLK